MLPARHFKKFSGTATQGQMKTLSHGLKTALYPSGITPDAVLADLDSGTYTAAPNTSIGCYSTSTTAYVYLSNWDPSNSHTYSLVVRSYNSLDATNI
jgi:hypothetical protein